ncbi:hypothetical protein TKK_0014552 [Trichogramma kaykai]
MFICQFCEFQTELFKNFSSHRNIHYNITKNINCGYEGCKKMFGQEPHLKVHLIRNHGISLKDNSLTHSKDCSDERGKFICTVELCKKEHNSFQTLIIHLKEHIRDQELITCPYRDCDKQYSILSSFTGHLTKKHKNRTPDTEKDLSAEDNCNNVDVPSDIDIEQADSHAIHDVPSTTDDLSGTTNDSAGSSNLSIDLFHTNIAQLYLKLESEFLVPNSTIQHIVTANNAIDEQRLDILKSRLFQRLEKENVQLDLIHKIMSIMNEVDPIPLTNKLFGTVYKRKKFYKTHFKFVEPVPLTIDKKKKTFFTYVPIISTLTNMLQDKFLFDQLDKKTSCVKPVYACITDQL